MAPYLAGALDRMRLAEHAFREEDGSKGMRLRKVAVRQHRTYAADRPRFEHAHVISQRVGET